MLRTLLALALCSAAAARAECSRDINVPLSASGASIVVNGDTVNGIYPDLMRALAPKAGCNFIFSVVPRARQVAMFENGTADLLIPATRTSARDRLGIFVPMMGHRAMLISLMGNHHAPISSGQELLEHHELRVAVVRGFDYGEPYQALLEELGKQGRVFTEVDVVAVARLLQAGSADVTIMGPTILDGAIRHDPRIKGLSGKLRMEALPELPWGQVGAYISRSALPLVDQALLHEWLERAAKTNAVLEAYQRYHPADILAESVRPR